LQKAYLSTIGDLAKADLALVQAVVGKKWGIQLHEYANGIDNSPVHTQSEEAKGYSNSVTLETDVTDYDRANQILLALADSVCSRMRSDGIKAQCVAVTIRGNDFKNRSHQRKLQEPTDITAEVYALCKELFREVWDRRTPLRLLGVALTDIAREEESVQLSLFSENEERVKARLVDRTVDEIRHKFGYNTIQRGATCGSSTIVGKKYQAKLENQKKEK
ncbi:MAG: DNA polymerase IV, partial [Clostridia bacterium]|nr:DNA polymerase IV [Clostridia bacterium]